MLTVEKSTAFYVATACALAGGEFWGVWGLYDTNDIFLISRQSFQPLLSLLFLPLHLFLLSPSFSKISKISTPLSCFSFGFHTML